MVDFTSFLQPLYPVLIAIFFMALLFGVLSTSKIFSASTATNVIISAVFGLLVLLIAWSTESEKITEIFKILPILLMILLLLVIFLGMFGVDMKDIFKDINLKWYFGERTRTPPTVIGTMIKAIIYPLIVGIVFWFLIQFIFMPLGIFEENPITALLNAFFTPDIFLTILIIVGMIALMWYFVRPEQKE
ncbi:MAG: hypothetical protein CVU81_00820 [Euryarchaeota archaeon HGW-Euryarchaeota-1]|nr:MAG: hypothetical protein CVU81_00820 [Euryarchaeota archaeon HGW-Euryarchaeota-1]